jgi:hypothetical protein
MLNGLESLRVKGSDVRLRSRNLLVIDHFSLIIFHFAFEVQV